MKVKSPEGGGQKYPRFRSSNHVLAVRVNQLHNFFTYSQILKVINDNSGKLGQNHRIRYHQKPSIFL